MMSGGPVLKKCRTGSSVSVSHVVVVDRTSELPDDIIVRILSFLPFHQAATTSLVSHRWLHLWKYRPKLQLISRHSACLETPQQTLDHVNWVNSVINSHRGSVQEFTIDFNATKSYSYQVAKWLEYAFQRQVERLDMSFDCWSEITATLKEILENVTIPTSGGIQSLKVLHLTTIKTNGDAIQFLLTNCPMLERLVINKLIMTSDLKVFGSSLKHLDIVNFRNNKYSIKISAPNLTWLEIDYDTRNCFFENVPKFANMTIYCRFHDSIHDFATAASQLETLAISLDRSKAPFSVPEMPKLKKLVVDDYLDLSGPDHPPFPITCFLRASPSLEEFEVQITELALEDGVFEVPKVGPIFRHLNLKRLKLLWFCGGSPCGGRIDLVRYIVGNCVALEEIDIRQCDGTKSGRLIYGKMVEDCIHVASAEERRTFEKTIQLELPAHIKLGIANHTHKYRAAH